MELQDFIKNTLIQITNGVVEAQKELKDSGCLINPEGLERGNQIHQGYQNEFRSIQKIKMNVILDVSKSTSKSSGIGVAKIIKAGLDSEDITNNKEVTSIEFEIPIAFPVMS
jgi:hypothetical protein